MKSIQIIPFKYFDHDAVQIKIIQNNKKEDQDTGNLTHLS